MQPDGAQTIASFTGTLLRREHTVGQKFVQLVFRENDKDVLCISTDPKDSAWQIGQAYHVEGTFRERAGRVFIQDPRITRLKKHWSLAKRLVVGTAVVAIIGVGGTVFALHGHAAPVPVPSAPEVAQTTVATTETPTPPAATPAVSTPTAPAPVTSAVATTKKTSKVIVTTPAVTTPAPAVATTPAPVDTCTTQVVPFDTVYHEDDSLDPGTTGPSTQTGAYGSEQVCSISGVKITTAPISEIISVGPPVTP
jgi:hypothetical protein